MVGARELVLLYKTAFNPIENRYKILRWLLAITNELAEL